jgi:hypothetical protein
MRLLWSLIVCFFSIGLILNGCETRQISQLKSENDSLRNQLVEHNEMVNHFRQLNVLLDSIDPNGNFLHKPSGEEDSFERVVSRLQQINDYITKTEQYLEKIKKDLAMSKHEASAYLMMVDALKGEVVIRDKEIEGLAVKVNSIENQKIDLVKNVKQHEDALAELQTLITARELELVQAKALTARLRASEAEAYYSRARIVETEAAKIKMAPGKKRETYQEALELYRKAYALGKEEALNNINGMQKNFPQAFINSHNKRTSAF